MLNPVETLNVSRIHAISVVGLDEVNRHGLIPTHPSLQLVTAPRITAGTAVTAAATPYIPIQIPTAFEPAFAQTTSFATPLVYPTTAIYPAGTPPSPCTFLTAGAPITAVCHCVYAQPCALHHRPITYAPGSFSTLSGMFFIRLKKTIVETNLVSNMNVGGDAG